MTDDYPCSEVVEIHVSIYVILTSTMLLSQLCILTAFIRNYIHLKSVYPAQKILFYIGLAFYICSIFDLTVLIPRVMIYCDEFIGQYWRWLHFYFYGFQQQLMLTVLFVRVYIAFNNSYYELSKKTKISYFMVQSICVVIVIAAGINLSFFSKKYSSILFGVYFIIYLGFIIGMMSLFVYKLLKVYKSSITTPDPEMLSLITRTTILTSVITFMIFLVPIFQGLSLAYEKSEHIDFCSRYVTVIGEYVSFICITISYKDFNSFYYLFCTCIDRRCTVCFSQVVGADIEMIISHIKSHNAGTRINIQSSSNISITPATSPSSK